MMFDQGAHRIRSRIKTGAPKAIAAISIVVLLLLFYFLSLGPVLWFFARGPGGIRPIPKWVLTVYPPAAYFAERYDGIYVKYLKWCDGGR